MTQDRIQYFEKILAKPVPEPFKAWLTELFEAAKGDAKPQKQTYQRKALVIDTPENTDA